MDKEKLSKLGPLFSELGAEAAAIVGGDTDGLFIYIEAEEGAVYAAIFKDEGEAVRYHDPTDELFYLARDAWEAESTDQAKRWLAMEYEVHGQQFNVHFTYPEEADPDMGSGDRRQASVERRFGDKPVIYPPIPDGFQQLD